MRVSIIVVRAIVDALARAGAPWSELLAKVSIEAERLSDPEVRVELEDLGKLLEAAIDVTQDAAFGMRVVEQLSHGSMGLVAHLLSHAPSVREALATATEFASLVVEGVRLPTHDDAGQFVIRAVVPRSTPLCDRVLTEMVMVGMVRLVAELTGSRVTPRYVLFEHERPPHYRAYEHEYVRHFGSNARFGQAHAAIAFDRELADRRQIHQHPGLFGLLRAEAERSLDRIQVGEGPVDRLRRYLVDSRSSGAADMAEAARSLGMSERSLRRHLAAEGTSYRDLVQAQLKAAALQLLQDANRPIKEVASSLGFVNVAAFTTAFKRWTGVTPGEYRKEPNAR